MGRGRGLLEGRLETIREGLHGAAARSLSQKVGEFFREGMSCY